MVKLYGIAIARKEGTKVIKICEEIDVSSFGFFQRNSVGEFIKFTHTLVLGKTGSNDRKSISQEAYMCHSYVTAENLAVCCIADEEYPRRPAFVMLSKLVEDFEKAFPNWKNINSAEFDLKQLLLRWQDPKTADSILKVQNELDETKAIVSETLEKILDRGQKLDDLVSRSDELSEQSKAFYKTAKKTNSWCCSVM
jgi:synaptobrevin family protein YKT6